MRLHPARKARERAGAGQHLRSIPTDAAPRSHLAKSNDYFCPRAFSSAYSRGGAVHGSPTANTYLVIWILKRINSIVN